MKKLTISIAKKLGYVSAVLVILAAILVVVSRVYIPALDNHRPDFERWAGEILEAPVTIKKARFSWYRYQPEISLYGLTLYDNKTNKPSLHLKRVRVFFSIPKSLWERKIILSGIMMTGAELNIEQTASGDLIAKELPQLGDMGGGDSSAAQETKVAEMLGWLMAQPRISLSDIDVHYAGYNGQKRFVTFEHLRFENDGDKHTALARAVLHQDIPTEVSMVVRGVGDMAELEKMKVDAYLNFSGLSLSQWAKNMEWHDWKIRHGLASAKIWLTWDKNAMQQVQSVFQVYELQMASGKKNGMHTINRLSADVGWKREGERQVLAADDVLLDMQDHIWPVTNLYMTLEPNKSKELLPKKISIGYFNVTDVLAFLESLPGVLPKNIKDAVDNLKPSGGVKNLSITFADNPIDWHNASVQAVLSQLNINPWKEYPGIRNLTGLMEFDGKHGKALIDSKGLKIDYQTFFPQPLWFDLLHADITFESTENNWLAKAASIKASNTNINVDANGYVRKQGNIPPYIDLEASFQVKNLRDMAKFLPTRVFKPGLNTWLQNAFLGGYTQNGHATIQGPLNEVPFSHGNGKFNITTEVKDTSLKFAPDWPQLDDINANVEFIGSKVLINVANANIMGINTGAIVAIIPELGGDKPTELVAKTKNIATDFALGMKVIQNSPLNLTIGKMFKDLEVSGPVLVDFDLIVPLANPDNIKVDGTINLSKIRLGLPAWRLQLHDMTGLVHFTEDTTDSGPISGTLFDKPLTLSLKTIKKNGSIVRASTTSNLAIEDLESWLKVPFSKVITGATDIQTNIDLSFDKPIQLHIASDLLGAKIELPAPYAKPAEAKINFTSDITIQSSDALRVRMDYGDQLNAALTLTTHKSDFQLQGVNLRIGAGTAAWPAGKGIYITGNIPRLDMQTIKSYASQTSGPIIPGLDLVDIDVTVKAVDLLGQDLKNVRLELKPVKAGWNVAINNDDLSGEITLPEKMDRHGKIKARFDKIDLDVGQSDAKINEFDVSTIPEIDFSAGDVAINDMLFGRVSFNLIPASKGMTIKSLTIHTPNMDLNASGSWEADNGSSHTQLHGVLATTNVNKFFNDMNYKLDNFIASKGSLKFDLSWPAAPYAPELGRLNGEAKLDLGAGRIVDVGEENDAKMDIGRLLSIFSLQSIPRRLSLDFSDLVEKGYSFDSLKGDFRLSTGNVYTSNAQFDGPVASVGIKGRIGVEDKNVDLKLNVTPHVAASLPIAATLIGGPIAGIASLAVNSVVSAAVSSVATHEYSVKGPWNNPQWNTVEPPKPVLQHRR